MWTASHYWQVLTPSSPYWPSLPISLHAFPPSLSASLSLTVSSRVLSPSSLLCCHNPTPLSCRRWLPEGYPFRVIGYFISPLAKCVVTHCVIGHITPVFAGIAATCHCSSLHPCCCAVPLSNLLSLRRVVCSLVLFSSPVCIISSCISNNRR